MMVKSTCQVGSLGLILGWKVTSRRKCPPQYLPSSPMDGESGSYKGTQDMTKWLGVHTLYIFCMFTRRNYLRLHLGSHLTLSWYQRTHMLTESKAYGRVPGRAVGWGNPEDFFLPRGSYSLVLHMTAGWFGCLQPSSWLKKFPSVYALLFKDGFGEKNSQQWEDMDGVYLSLCLYNSFIGSSIVGSTLYRTSMYR